VQGNLFGAEARPLLPAGYPLQLPPRCSLLLLGCFKIPKLKEDRLVGRALASVRVDLGPCTSDKG